jgi:dipeptidase D
MSNPLSNLEPKSVFHSFGELSKYPRPSKKEEKAVAFLEKWAKENNIKVEKDARGNVLLTKPATAGMENRQSVCLQGHIDMVCVAEKGHKIDFDNDPIDVYVDGDWVKARGTTLGADDGLAVAMGMAIMEAKDIPHPNIEFLCTLDEETGLTGASGLANNLIKSKILINIDSENEGYFTIGCAGGINTIAHYKYIPDNVPANVAPYKIVVEGLKGGHSGIEINAGRANANKVLTRILWKSAEKFGISVSTFDGGSKHNAIPSDASSIIVVPNDKKADFEKYIAEMNETVKKEFATVEPNVKISTQTAEMPKRILAKDAQFKLLASFYTVAHGVLRMSPDIAGLVQSSTNFAIVETRENEIYVLTSQRSSVGSEKLNIVEKVKAAFLLGGATVETTDGYPAWEPKIDSPLLKLSTEIYRNMYKKEPIIETIHAGLECGLIGDKYDGMDMISIGPDLFDVHSPEERLSISSTKKVWDFLLELLKNIPVK